MHRDGFDLGELYFFLVLFIFVETLRLFCLTGSVVETFGAGLAAFNAFFLSVTWVNTFLALEVNGAFVFNWPVLPSVRG